MRQAIDFNSSLIDSNVDAFDALSCPVARKIETTGVSPVDSAFAYEEAKQRKNSGGYKNDKKCE
ncbi:MAG: hypothetical protein K6G44_10290 [Lentisphaeria bacterium]|nr:hypothetical protein [Lentisphaeria bacterium]